MTSNQFHFGFIIPLLSEAKPLIDQLQACETSEINGRQIYTGKLGNKRVTIIISGYGKIKSASATQLLIDHNPSKVYIHYGTAGALSPKLKIGDIVVAASVIEHDVRELFPVPKSPPIHPSSPELIKKLTATANLIFGTIASGDEDITSSLRRDELFNKHQALSVDWESAGFALTCQLNNVPGIIFRTISDLAYEHTNTQYQANQERVINNLVVSIISQLPNFSFLE
jgi:adenosylhomocysteine nucleosidase